MGDRERVLEFTHNTFPWGDYIHRVFDRWFADKSGRLLVAEVDGVVVGLSFVKLTKKREAWLQGGRVDKNYRRKGIGRELIRECLRTARDEMKAGIARLITDKTNSVAQKLVSSLGFKKVSEYVRLDTKAEHIKDRSLLHDVRLADERSTPQLWQFIRSSPAFKKSGGLYTIRYVWYTLDKEDLRRFSAEGKTLIYCPGEKIHGVLLMDEGATEAGEEKSVQSCYLDSDSGAGVEALSNFLVDHAAGRSLYTVNLWTYSDKRVVEPLREIGFGGEIDESTEVVYSKKL